MSTPASRPGYPDRPHFEEYREKFKDFFVMERRDGVILARMHHQGGSAKFDFSAHNAWGQAWHDIGNDPENQVMILTGTGDEWVGNHQMAFTESLEERPAMDIYDNGYYDGLKVLDNLIFGVDMPTIAAINGPGSFTMLGLMCDITICADTAAFYDAHFPMGIIPGDGQNLAFQELLGAKRAAYHLYTGKPIDAWTALDLGLVNEVTSVEDLLPRAWEIAALIMQKPRMVRCMTAQIIRRPWKRRLVEDFQFGFSHEQLAVLASAPDPQMMNTVLERSMADAKAEAKRRRRTS